MAECREMFGDYPKQDLAVVCDDCFQGMEAQRKAAGISLETFREPTNPAALDAAYKSWADQVEAEFNALPEDVRKRINEVHEAVMAQMFPVYSESDFDC